MKRKSYKQHSAILDEDMSMIVYGEAGYPVVAFQTEDSKCQGFEEFGMIDALAPFIEEGRIQVFSVDSLDEQSWCDQGADNGVRALRQEQYFQHVCSELLDQVHSLNKSERRPLAVGCGLGAVHAALAVLRRPDLFEGCISLSGVYHTSHYYGDWMDEVLYQSDIPAFLANMPTDHAYVDLYNQRQLVMCVGQGAWEEGIDDLRAIDAQLNRLGVKHWCDFWGYDVSHDWPWWHKQMPYFMNEVLTSMGATPEEAPKKPAAKRTTTRKAAPKKAAAKSTAKADAPAVEAAATEAVAEAAKSATKRATTAKKTATTKAATTKTASTKAAASTTKAAATKATETKAAATTKAAETKAAATKTTTTEAADTKAATTKATAATKAAAEDAAAPQETATTTARKTTTRRTTSRSTKKAGGTK